MVDQLPNFRRMLAIADEVIVHQHAHGTEVEVVSERHGLKRFWVGVVNNPEWCRNRWELVVEERK